MMRILFVFAALLCVANALVQSGLPMKNSQLAAPVSRAVAPTMVVEGAAADAAAAAVSSAGLMLAANAGDFGGYTIPIIGLATLAGIISLLAGPVED
ncbi:hypothetical protein EMIHUDRAFT_422391 [Emiliania huxleyi CCMP1516]|uniref:Uncharacterized protein n=2 Tax=Emiliania huxleyi TaxID=2903 RepID=A0A0D3IF11_EMIH1|nr:hypothetical protein EMIHUDRAFT_422391 [Emiliania huxleyi CCMP1516]EOD09846.1 hypothetical protein EMIHUDRAFT_422391 [Emiliania huxleyi CCMP1516]|mmetsp:Transcript_47483/g.157385  ORF Transcript_47483/g.157385 Transcript_47483/m.157385 type:complete len:97 (-) Transcript_47483:319-609(-)|eukprot:XP_005762275.1 hypothetical protein EMIHUDRAFT_422391 [Emiliania huxleyi CCMP1516]